MGTQDPNIRRRQTIDSIPPYNVTTVSNIAIAASGSGTFIITSTPANTALSLWNMAWSIWVDNYLNDNYQWPIGASLTPGVYKNSYIFEHQDWNLSSDLYNNRAWMIHIYNGDTVGHTYYLANKSYTVAEAVQS